MRLPNAHNAVVQIEKLRDYCLNPFHPRGRHKARVFAATLGLNCYNAEWLRAKLLEAARTQNAVRLEKHEFGAHYLITFELEHQGRTATIRSLWLVRHDEDFPRLSTCYVE